ncbi:hypothetical protein AB0I60_03730 [Actinosynnema sp. NPDC050436]|uniref:hypothetical protein n=1 Tax=Actinosynnema sp. NPDC050436 TaxID=3155659 RepID=UPI0033C4CF98
MGVGPSATVYFLQDDEGRDRDYDADKVVQSVSVAVAAGPSRAFAVVLEPAGGVRSGAGFEARALHRDPGEEVRVPAGPVVSGDAQRFVFRVTTGPQTDGRPASRWARWRWCCRPGTSPCPGSTSRNGR